MRYRLGVEGIKNDHWIAWVFDLPGCYSSGKTRAEAIGNAGASIAAYRLWIARHRQETLLDDPYMDIHVAEVSQTTALSPHMVTHAFFEEDRLFLDQDEISQTLALLDFTRADILALVRQTTAEQRAAPISRHAHGSVDGILRHIASIEWWYLDRLGMAFPETDLPSDPLECLEKVRVRLREVLPSLAGDERILTKDDEQWSARKIIRCALWHERDHTQQIARLIGL